MLSRPDAQRSADSREAKFSTSCCQRTLPLAGADEELALVERRIEAAELEQLRVRTPLDQLSLVEDEDHGCPDRFCRYRPFGLGPPILPVPRWSCADWLLPRRSL